MENQNMRNLFAAAIFSIGMLFLAAAGTAHAELPKMGLPIKTTIIVTKPPPGEIYGNKQLVTMGVGDKIYKFILKDGYTDHMKIRWPDVWEYVQQFNPNFVVQGQDAETFAKMPIFWKGEPCALP